MGLMGENAMGYVRWPVHSLERVDGGGGWWALSQRVYWGRLAPWMSGGKSLRTENLKGYLTGTLPSGVRLSVGENNRKEHDTRGRRSFKINLNTRNSAERT